MIASLWEVSWRFLIFCKTRLFFPFLAEHFGNKRNEIDEINTARQQVFLSESFQTFRREINEKFPRRQPKSSYPKHKCIFLYELLFHFHLSLMETFHCKNYGIAFTLDLLKNTTFFCLLFKSTGLQQADVCHFSKQVNKKQQSALLANSVSLVCITNTLNHNFFDRKSRFKNPSRHDGTEISSQCSRY